MERYLFTESNGLRRKFFQLDNFRNFPSKISLIRKYSHKKDRNFVAFGIKARPSRHAAGISPFRRLCEMPAKQKPRLLGATAVQKFILVF
jgi:hypothetical protein